MFKREQELSRTIDRDMKLDTILNSFWCAEISAQDAMLQLIAGSMMAQTGSVPTTAAEHINQSQVEIMKKFQVNIFEVHL